MTFLTDALAWLADRSRPIELESAEGVLATGTSTKLVDLEKYQPHRRRQTASFTTDSISAFCDQVYNEASKLEQIVFISPAKMEARCVHDFWVKDENGDYVPGHAEYKSYLQLAPTGDYDNLHALVDGEHSQREAITAIEDLAHCIENAGSLVAALRRLDVNKIKTGHSSVGQFSQERSLLESVEISSSETLPETINVTLQCFAQLPTIRELKIRIVPHVDTDSSRFWITFSAVSDHLITESLGEEFVALVRSGTDQHDNIEVMLGELKTL